MFNVYDSQLKKIEYESFVFSGGEVHVKITAKSFLHVQGVIIIAQLHSANAVLELAMLVDALRRHYTNLTKIELVAPYFPYARQDRQCDTGEALSVKVMAGIINNLNLNKVLIWDAHSDVTPALLNNVINVPPHEFVEAVVQKHSNVVLVAPDAGAIKKVSSVAKYLKKEYVRADKLRDPHTGAITGTVVYSDHIGDKDFLIVDDICDGGKTFIELAKVLRPLTNGKIFLYVTHGIFSKGIDVFDGVIDHVYSANTFDQKLEHRLFTRI